MFYKFCYGFIGFGFLFMSIRIFVNKKFERFAIEHDFSSLGDTYFIPAIISLAASFAFSILLCTSQKTSKNARVVQILILLHQNPKREIKKENQEFAKG